MRPFQSLVLGCALLMGFGASLPCARAGETDRLAARVTRALEAHDAGSLGSLFPSDRKVRVSLDRIADLKGYVGPGPLVEALRRYLASRSEVRFDADPGSGKGGDSGAIRVRGSLSTRDASGQRERVGMVFIFELIEGDWRAVEVRETG
jgi:hypothetical protein